MIMFILTFTKILNLPIQTASLNNIDFNELIMHIDFAV